MLRLVLGFSTDACRLPERSSPSGCTPASLSVSDFLVEHPRPDNQCNGRWGHSPSPVRPFERSTSGGADPRGSRGRVRPRSWACEAPPHSFLCGFFLVSVLVVFGIWNVATSRVPAIAQYFPATEDWAQLPFVGLAFAYIFVVFGFLSRRCERQADVFGCRAVSVPVPTASFMAAKPCCCRRERDSARRGSAPSSTRWKRLRA